MKRTANLSTTLALPAIALLLMFAATTASADNGTEDVFIGGTDIATITFACGGTSCTVTETMNNKYSQKVQDGSDFNFNAPAGFTVEGGSLNVNLVGGGSTSDVKFNFSTSGGNVSSLGSFTYQLSAIGSNGGSNGSNTLGSTTSVAGLSFIIDCPSGTCALNEAALILATLNTKQNNAAIHFCSPDSGGHQSGSCPGPTGFAANQGGVFTPEPSSMMLLGTGFLGIAGLIRRRLIS